MSYGFVSIGLGVIWTGNEHTSVLFLLYSECLIPVPAEVNCTSPRLSISKLPIESLCSSSPETMYDQMRNSAWL